MFSDSSRNYIRNKVRKFKNPFFDISFNLIYNIYIYIKFSYAITFENLMNNATSHLLSLLCKSSVSKYMIMVSESSNMCINTLERLDPQFTN